MNFSLHPIDFVAVLTYLVARMGYLGVFHSIQSSLLLFKLIQPVSSPRHASLEYVRSCSLLSLCPRKDLSCACYADITLLLLSDDRGRCFWQLLCQSLDSSWLFATFTLCFWLPAWWRYFFHKPWSLLCFCPIVIHQWVKLRLSWHEMNLLCKRSFTSWKFHRCNSFWWAKSFGPLSQNQESWEMLIACMQNLNGKAPCGVSAWQIGNSLLLWNTQM